MSKRRAIIDDGCCPYLVEGAEFMMPLGIPVIKKTQEIIIPSGITPFSQRNKVAGAGEALGFYEMDMQFADILIHPQNYTEEFKRFDAIISPDCSLYRDAPMAVQVTNLYRNRAIGVYYQMRGLNVIPQIRWGNEYTYTTKYFPEKIAFLGVEKHSVVAIGTYGCCKSREDKYHIEAGLSAMMSSLEPEVVLVYGSMPEKIFGKYDSYSRFVQYSDWTTRMHG
ncbi:protein of unknown function [Lachnospiraceae bacterium XPB1003]|nr:protein of unknown function [Lachnospiraceae bacterium XPB1003]